MWGPARGRLIGPTRGSHFCSRVVTFVRLYQLTAGVRAGTYFKMFLRVAMTPIRYVKDLAKVDYKGNKNKKNKQLLCSASGWTGFRSWGDCTLFRVAAAAVVGWQLLVLLLRHRCFGLLHDHGIHCHLLNLETLREREGGGCYSNGSQQAALGPIGPSWRHQNQFFTPFF